MTMAIGCSISWPGMSPAITSGTSARPVARAVIRIGAAAPARPAGRARAERHALLVFEVLEVADQHDAVAGRDAEDREEPDERAERDDAVAEETASDAADERHRQRQEGRAPPAACCRTTDRAGGRSRAPAATGEAAEAALRRLALGVLAEQLGVVAERELAPSREPLLDVPRRSSRGRVLSTLAPTSMRRERSGVDELRRRGDRHVGDLAELDRRAVRGVDRQVLMAREAVGGSPGVLQTLHVVGPLALAIDVADLLAGDQRGGRAADSPGLRPCCSAASRSTVTSTCGTSAWSSTCSSIDAVDVGEELRSTSSALVAQVSRSSP